MIREKLLALRERRSLLIAHCELQRIEVFTIIERVERAAAWIDRAKAIALNLRAHPVWLAAGVALLVAARPRKALKLFATGFSLWRGWRNLRAMMERFAPAHPAARRAY